MSKLINTNRVGNRGWMFITVLMMTGMIVHRVSSQDLDKILEEHYRASAQEKMAQVETMITTGRNIYSMAGFESAFRIYQARPDRIRIEGDIQGSAVIQTYNGERGWIYAPMMGITEPNELTGHELKNLLGQAEFENPLWNYAAKGFTLEIVREPEEESAIHLRLMSEDGDVRHFFIDRDSDLITSLRTSQVMGGSENEMEILLDNYKKVKGIPVAHRIVTRMNGQVVTTMQLDEVEFNSYIDPNLFEKPVTEK